MLALLSLFALGVLIFIHEIGHLVAARLVGIRASHVMLGFGPPLVTGRRKGLRLTLGAVPLGGAVELMGENPHDVEPEHITSVGYFAQAAWKRLLVQLGGPLMNFGVAFAVLFALHLSGTHNAVPLTVGNVTPGSEAAHAQLRPGDKLTAVDGQSVGTWAELMHRISAREGQDLTLMVERPGVAFTAHVVPHADAAGLVRIGISQQYVYQVMPVKAALGAALEHCLTFVHAELALLVKLLKGSAAAGLEDAGRAVRGASEAAAAGGLDASLRAFAALSLALGLFHLLPIPALDGGRTLLVVWELFRKKRLNPHVLTSLQAVGLLALLGLLLWVAFASYRHLGHLVG
jgi:regulator of sigma E protease